MMRISKKNKLLLIVLGLIFSTNVVIIQAAGFNPVVHQAQTLLAAAGFHTGVLDGKYGPKTREAIQNYQKSKSLSVTGQLDDQTLASLNIGVSTDLVNNIKDWRDVPTQIEIDKKLVHIINDPTNIYSNYLPDSPGGGLDLPGQSILDAMKRSSDKYGSGLPGKSNHTKTGYDLMRACLQTKISKGPTHWSDITIHYYCQMSQPRRCYTSAFAERTPNGLPKNSRVDAYNGCANNTLPHSDEFRWVTKDQSLVFQYVMFGQTNAFKHEQEQAIINAFYGVKDPSNKKECKEKRPLRSEDPTDGTHCLVNKTMTKKLVGRSY